MVNPEANQSWDGGWREGWPPTSGGLGVCSEQEGGLALDGKKAACKICRAGHSYCTVPEGDTKLMG